MGRGAVELCLQLGVQLLLALQQLRSNILGAPHLCTAQPTVGASDCQPFAKVIWGLLAHVGSYNSALGDALPAHAYASHWQVDMHCCCLQWEAAGGVLDTHYGCNGAVSL
jgi:hypothetical protein